MRSYLLTFYCRERQPGTAKTLYPDKFTNTNMGKERNEIMTAFPGVDGVYSEYADYLIFSKGRQI